MSESSDTGRELEKYGFLFNYRNIAGVCLSQKRESKCFNEDFVLRGHNNIGNLNNVFFGVG